MSHGNAGEPHAAGSGAASGASNCGGKSFWTILAGALYEVELGDPERAPRRGGPGVAVNTDLYGCALEDEPQLRARARDRCSKGREKGTTQIIDPWQVYEEAHEVDGHTQVDGAYARSMIPNGLTFAERICAVKPIKTGG